MRLLYMMLVVGVLFQGCSKVEEEPLDVDGIERNFTAYIPESEDYALIIALHGGGESIVSFERYAGLTELQETSESFGVVYLDGVDRHWNDGRKELNSTVDDVAFIEQIIKKYGALGASKFYVVGMSNGGLMAQRAACELGSSISGIAVVAATQSTFLQENCTDNTTVMDALFIFGSEDSAFVDSGDIVNPMDPREMFGRHILITPTVGYWQNRNLCIGDFIPLETIDNEALDETVVNHYSAALCSAKIEYYQVEGGGHRWPNPDSLNLIPQLGKVSHEISAGEKIVQFFEL